MVWFGDGVCLSSRHVSKLKVDMFVSDKTILTIKVALFVPYMMRPCRIDNTNVLFFKQEKVFRPSRW